MNLEHESIVSQEWEACREQRESLRDNGAGRAFASLPGFADAFTKSSKGFSIMCIDEGCIGAGTHLAGSGCGISEAQLLQELTAAGITEFTTHQGCGAWALARPGLTHEGEKEAAVIAWGKEIAQKAGLPHRHISALEMNRPVTLHNAFYAIYDGTGCFNRSRVPKMKAGFVTSPKYFSSALDNLKLAVKIACGAHGFGNLFSRNDPFMLIGIHDQQDTIPTRERMIADLTAVMNEFPEGTVLIDTIQVPVGI